MKRIVAVLIVLVMVCAYAVAGADQKRVDHAEENKEYAKDIVKTLAMVYDLDPDSFDADYIYLLYSYYRLYSAASSLSLAEQAYNLRLGKSAVFSDLSRGNESTTALLDKVMMEKYVSWLNGELSDREYCDTAIPAIKSLMGL